MVDSTLENSYFSKGYHAVAGMDEVGRGCLAGPVMVGVTVLLHDKPVQLKGLKDSKELTPKKREILFPKIKQELYCAVGEASAEEIDQFGIVHCLGLAGSRALNLLKIVPDEIILDGTHNWLHTFTTIPVDVQLKADTRCTTVAAASIIAKVTRDQRMVDLAYSFPDYAWEKNKGYGTVAHRAAIREFGTTDYHRKTWKLL
ncbi:MAG: ribonuclease HII [Micrococcaceae bacterium]